MNTVPKEIVEEIRKALDAATPGPWNALTDVVRYGYGMQEWICQMYDHKETETAEYTDAEANAHLIANAPTWLRSLLEENERLTAEMDERESIVKRKLKIKQESVDETMTENQQLREELVQVKKERDGWRGEAKRERELSERIVEEREEAIIEVERLCSQLAAKDKVQKQLREFSHSIFIAGFQCRELDGADIQELGTKHGLLIEEPYDPEKHGDDFHCSPGDPFYTYSSILDQYKDK